MSERLVETLWLAITPIEAQNQLKALTVADWSSMKPSARKKLHKDLHALAYPSELRTKKSITTDDLKRLMGSK